jgi:NADH-quinone oxidoreductase subunit J
METLYFLIVTLVAVVSSIMVLTCKNPINSALSLILTFFCLATYYVMLDAPFLAAVQVMVYAGAIMVLIVFTIMLLNIRVDATKKHAHMIFFGCIIGFATLVNTAFIVFKSKVATPTGPYAASTIKDIGHTEMIGREMFTTFLLPFEITSILLLVAIVGAVIIAKKKI